MLKLVILYQPPLQTLHTQHLLHQGTMMLMTSSMACTTPRPSHSPIEPPTEERKELKVGCTREVVVTSILWSNVMPMVLVLFFFS